MFLSDIEDGVDNLRWAAKGSYHYGIYNSGTIVTLIHHQTQGSCSLDLHIESGVVSD